MSRTVDERVVEMRFDNKHFESNVATSMSTLDKLKQKLNLSGASKGLEEIDAASKKVNMSGLGGAVDTVKAKFSALDVVAVTALANITNQAVNAGKRMVSALTIDPVMSGFKEYETQINAVQTILANTSSKGTTIDDVTAALDELNKYADLTIYNFTEMTRNIGTFTAAGIDLETSVSAIQGIANLAAVSGSTSQQASVAMYQLSQALASGTVKLMDWNSVVNAGMGGEVFQNALKETSRLLGTGADAAIEASGSFRESLSKGWLTAEVLTETLKKFTTSGANEYVAEYTGLSVEAVEAALKNAKAQYGEADAIEEASKALAEKSGKNKDEIKAVLQMAQTATDAATKVKTFSQLWDVMKEAAQSGWAKTWQIIIGDFEEAKALLTPLADFFTNIINKISDSRNKLLESALGKSFSNLAEKIATVLKPASEAAETVAKVTDALGDLDDIVNKVIMGDFGNGHDRVVALTEAGKNYYEIQNKVNEALGNSFRYSEKQIASQDRLLGKQRETTDAVSDSTEATSESKEETVKLTDAQKDQIKTLIKLSDAELKAKGYKDEQIEAFRELRSTAEKLGIPLDDFIDNLDEINGRWLLINSFKNIGQALIKVFKAIGGAWRRIFDPVQSDQIFNIIAAIHKFTASLIPTDRQVALLIKTFKGLFAILDIVKTIIGGGIRIAFKVLSSILKAFDLNILDVTARIGDALVAFRDWLLEGNALAKGFNWLISKIPVLVEKFKEWFNVFKQTPAVQKLVDAIKAIEEAFNKLTSGEISLSEFAASLGKNLAKALKSLPGIALQIGKDFIAGFKNGVSDSIGGAIKKIVNFCIEFVASFAEALGVHSPSWKAYNIVIDFFKGAINAIKDAISSVIPVLKKIGEKIVEVFKSFWDFITDESGNIEWGKIFAGGAIIGLIVVLKQVADAFSGVSSVLKGIGNLLYEAGEALEGFDKVLRGIAWDFKAQAILKMAIAIGILVAAIWVLTKACDDPWKLLGAIGVIVVLSGILIGMAFALEKLSQSTLTLNKSGLDVKGLKTTFLQIGLAILMLALVVKMIGKMDPNEAEKGFKGLAAIAVGMIVFLAAIGRISRYSGDVGNFGKIMLKISIAMLVMVFVMKTIARMDPDDIVIGLAVLQAFTILCIEMGIANRIAGGAGNSFGGNVLKISIAMGIMTLVMKMLSGMDPEDIVVGIAALQAFVILIGEMAIINRVAGGSESKFGGVVMKIAASMLLLTSVIWLLSKMDESAVKNGIKVMQSFVLLIAEMVVVSRLAGKESAKIAGTILAMSAAIAILAGVSVLLSFMDLKSLAKGITAVTILSAMMALMVKCLKGAQNAKGAIMMMAITIAIMAGAVAGLSFIDTTSLISAAGAMSVMMGMLAIMMKSMKGLGKEKVPIKPIVALSGVILILAGIIYLLKDVEPSSAISAAGALSLLLLSMAVVVKIVSAVGSMAKNALKGVGILALMVVPLLAFTWVLSKMSGVTDAMSNVKALTLLAGALTIMLIPLTIVGVFAGHALLGVLALTSMIIPLRVFIDVLALMSGVSNATTNAELLSNFMTAMADVLFKISLVAPLALVADVAITGLIAVMGVVGVLAVAIGALMEKVPSIQEFLNTGLPVLEQLAGSIGTMIGNFVGGIISGIGNAILDLLPSLGIALSEFMVGAMPFIAIAQTIDSSVVEGAAYMTAAILMLTVSDFLAGIAQLLNGGVSFSDLGAQLMLFGIGAVAFFNLIKGVDSEAVEAASSVANMILALSVSELISAITDFLGGDTDFSTLGEDLKTFGEAVVGFSDTINGKVNTASVEAAASAGMMLAELNKSLPRSGGFLQDLIGEQDFGKFAESCKAFAGCIIDINETISQEGFKIESEKIQQITTAGTQFSELNGSLPRTGGIAQDLAGEKDLEGFGAACSAFCGWILLMNTQLSREGLEIQSDKIQQVVTAGTQFSELNESLPKTGGIFQDLAGEEDLAGFGTSCKAFVDCMIKVNEAVNQEGFSVNLDAMEAIKQAGLKMNELQESLPKTGGWWQAIAGEEDISDFGEKIAAFGEAMAGFSESAKGVDSAGIDIVMGAAHRMKNLMLELVDIDTDGFDDFIDDVVEELGEAMADFSDEVEDINTEAVSVSVDAAKKLRSLIASLVGLDTSGIENFKPQPIGTQMKGYAEKVKGMDTGIVESSAASAIRLKNLISSLSTLDPSGVNNFKPGPIAASLRSYSNSITGINFSYVLNSLTVASNIKSFLSNLNGFNSSGAASFKNAVDQLAQVNISGVVDAFSGASTKMMAAGAGMISGLIKGMESKLPLVTTSVTKILTGFANGIKFKMPAFEKAGETLLIKIGSGFTEKSKDLKTAAEFCASSAVTGIRGKYTQFYNAGSYLVTGFCNGISENSYKAAAKAKAMAEAAIKAAREALDINSPSKVFKEIGSGVPEGFAMGIGMLGNKVDASVTKMASSAINSGKKAMAIVLDALNSDIDSQPTIRPVVDLTDVKTGASAISGMFNGVQTVGVRSNLGAISTTMNAKLQNGSNDDIISAINKLNDNLESNRGDTYHFGNFTYDDGSNINDAVQTLVRAAIMGRRV